MTDDGVYSAWSTKRLAVQPLKSGSRYVALRAVLTRGRGNYSMASVYARVADGRTLRDQRIAAVTIHTPPGSEASSSMVGALRALADHLEEQSEPAPPPIRA